MRVKLESGHLCARCQTGFRMLSDTNEVPFEESSDPAESRPRGHYHPEYKREIVSTTQSLEDAAMDGCFVCYRVMQDRVMQDLEDLSSSIDPISLLYRIDDKNFEEHEEVEDWRFSVRVTDSKGDFIWVYYVGASFNNGFPKSVTSSSTGSEESLEFVIQQLRHCDKKHEVCKASKPESDWYPTRLIYVGSDRDIEPCPRLILTSGSSIEGPYASLSHCWGKIQPLKLTMETLNGFLDGINPTLLPKTFLDAITVTRRIGLKYIWIDSLCIIQDSPQGEDWKTEARMMLQVHQHAYCNIAATHSQNSQQGLFHIRNPRLLMPIVVTVELGERCQTFRMQMSASSAKEWTEQVDDAPLNGRAWVTQERCVSRRIIHFGSEQIFWDCYELLGSEICPLGYPLLPGTEDDLVMTKQAQGPKHSVDERFLYYWHGIVDQYTSSTFTFTEKDKIIAISSLAKYLEKAWNTEYLAGLWRKNMEIQLLWQSHHRSEKRPVTSRAPSWSWLSTDARISNTKEWDWVWENPQVMASFSLIEIKVSQLANSEGNIVLRGYLMLRCILHKFYMYDNSGRIVIDDSREGQGVTFLEYEAQKDDAMFFIPVCYSHNSLPGGIILKGLVVKPSESIRSKPGTFLRCGVASVVLIEGSRDSKPSLSRFESTAGKEDFPCVEFDTEKGHLIRLE